MEATEGDVALAERDELGSQSVELTTTALFRPSSRAQRAELGTYYRDGFGARSGALSQQSLEVAEYRPVD